MSRFEFWRPSSSKPPSNGLNFHGCDTPYLFEIALGETTSLRSSHKQIILSPQTCDATPTKVLLDTVDIPAAVRIPKGLQQNLGTPI